MQQWKNFENQSIIGKDMEETYWLTFLGHPVQYTECSDSTASVCVRRLIWLVSKRPRSTIALHNSIWNSRWMVHNAAASGKNSRLVTGIVVVVISHSNMLQVIHSAKILTSVRMWLVKKQEVLASPRPEERWDGGGEGWVLWLCRVTSNIVWSHMITDTPYSSVMK